MRSLALVPALEDAGAPAVAAPLIEGVFRYPRFLATESRREMIRQGQEAEIEWLVGEVRAFQESLDRDAPD